MAAGALVQPLAAAIHGEGAGFAVRATVRTLLAILVELPWFLAVCALLAGGHDAVPASIPRGTRGHVFWTLWGTIGALALPAAFAWDLTNRQTAMAADLLEKQSWSRPNASCRGCARWGARGQSPELRRRRRGATGSRD